MLPSEIPIFPLPNVVLFPSTLLPLHIFEPRYRAMVEDALDGERLIGMVMLRPGWEPDYEGAPRVYPVGCAGFITHAEPLADGRYNIILRGTQKFRIDEERYAREGIQRYRVAQDRIDPGVDGGQCLGDSAGAAEAGEAAGAQAAEDGPRFHPQRRSGRRPRPCDRAAPRAARKTGAARMQQPARAV